MGLLDNIFGNSNAQRSGRGGPSMLTLGLLALLAYRTYQGKGRLADMLGRGEQPATEGASHPAGRVTGPGHLPGGAPAGPSGREGGGLGDILGGLLGGGPGSRPMSGSAGAPGGGLGDLLRGGLGGLLGGAAAGTVLNGGLNDLLRRFQEKGLGNAADSWVSRGPNQRIAPDELEAAVGRDTLQTLSDQSGRPYNEVLSELSESLPDTVDQLTPEGRPPSGEEAARWV
ncbi:MAG TPA: YidB family protein [Xanthobacteraceae bacterium]|nr:YidB family protein [Xanthobacteraceae bacterium]